MVVLVVLVVPVMVHRLMVCTKEMGGELGMRVEPIRASDSKGEQRHLAAAVNCKKVHGMVWRDAAFHGK